MRLHEIYLPSSPPPLLFFFFFFLNQTTEAEKGEVSAIAREYLIYVNEVLRKSPYSS